MAKHSLTSEFVGSQDCDSPAVTIDMASKVATGVDKMKTFELEVLLGVL